MLFENLEGWEGVGVGREVQEGRDAHVPTVDSCWYMAGITTCCKAIILQLKRNKFKLKKENSETLKTMNN